MWTHVRASHVDAHGNMGPYGCHWLYLPYKPHRLHVIPPCICNSTTTLATCAFRLGPSHPRIPTRMACMHARTICAHEPMHMHRCMNATPPRLCGNVCV